VHGLYKHHLRLLLLLNHHLLLIDRLLHLMLVDWSRLATLEFGQISFLVLKLELLDLDVALDCGNVVGHQGMKSRGFLLHY
jgi:hypothetical protein